MSDPKVTQRMRKRKRLRESGALQGESAAAIDFSLVTREVLPFTALTAAEIVPLLAKLNQPTGGKSLPHLQWRLQNAVVGRLQEQEDLDLALDDLDAPLSEDENLEVDEATRPGSFEHDVEATAATAAEQPTDESSGGTDGGASHDDSPVTEEESGYNKGVWRVETAPGKSII